MTDGTGLFHATQPAQPAAGDATAHERLVTDGVPSPHGEGRLVRRSRLGIGRVVGLLVAGAVVAWLYISVVTNNLGTAPPAVQAGNTDQMNQVQRRDEGDRLVRQPSAELAQLKQAQQQEHAKSEQPNSRIAADIAQLRQALQQERDEVGRQVRDLAAKQEELKQEQQRAKSEQPDSRAADMAQLRQALQQERDEVGRQIHDLAAKQAELKQALQQSDKGEQPGSQRTADMVQLKQALQEQRDEGEQQIRNFKAEIAELKQSQHERGKGEQQVREFAAELAHLKQSLQEERDKSDRLISEPSADMAVLKQAMQQAGDQSQQQIRDLAAELAQLKQALQRERARDEQLAIRFAADWAQLKQVLQQSETRSATYEKLLDQEHERTRALEEQVADLRGAPMSGRSNEATSPQSGLSAPTPVPAAKQPVTTPVLGDTAAIPAVDESATMTARPAAPEAPRTAGDLETVRLMERANLLVAQGDVGAARNVLERAAESGNAAALFALAETHDPVVLAAWGTLGTQGDVAKAKELYARALKGGIVEAKRRLEVLP
ncbi:MAG TPA: hypothetical protein VKY24_24720 [Reyranella sp.]|nr:hypothetical protein [Reyranella sp.]